jgi:hypothetical protein
MPRFFFDTYDGEHVLSDIDGVEFARIEEVREAAVKALPGIARDRLPDGDEMEMWVKVRDAAGRPVFEAFLKFSSRWMRRRRAGQRGSF